ncbi:MerR family transcriptional regulator [Streptomyces sp. NPDC002537]
MFPGRSRLWRGLLFCPGEVRVFLPDDLEHALWTTAEAAEAAGVSRDVIYQWKARGKLTPVARRGRPRYRALDVLRAEAATRTRACRIHTAS